MDYWGIAGAGDIPGVDGVGKKGATELLEKYGSLKAVYDLADKTGPQPTGALKKVLTQRDQADLSVRLAALQDHLELGG